jgi:hypothetical protein
MPYIPCTEPGDHCVNDGQGKPLHEFICWPGFACGVEEGTDFPFCVPRKFYFNWIKL